MHSFTPPPRTLVALALNLTSLALAGCSGAPTPSDSGGGIDVVSREASVDAPATDVRGDGSVRCAADIDCSDGVFCNGPERCAPTDPMADARGCVRGAAPCAASQTCNETADTCSNCPTPDADGDGVNSIACGGSDCDDNDRTRFPGSAEVCDGAGKDEDCNPCTVAGATDGDSDADTFINRDCFNAFSGAIPTCAATNVRVDGAARRVGGLDCDDASRDANPNTSEVACNNRDDNCDGMTDELPGPTWYQDADNDGFGNARNPRVACAQPAGYVANLLDCNDGAATINPAADDVCNGVDDNCTNVADDGAQPVWYRDADGDTFGDRVTTMLACVRPPGYVTNDLDCDDTTRAVQPATDEVCNGVDDNCSGVIDEGAMLTFYLDADGDGYGAAATSMMACAAPVGYVADGTDCDDAARTVNPRAAELCNGVDDNCNRTVDETTTNVFFRDNDGDGAGDPDNALPLAQCIPPMGYVSISGDCNDNDYWTYAGAVELCDRVDNRCLQAVGRGGPRLEEDGDADGFADTTDACTSTFDPGRMAPPAGRVLPKTDCDDARADVKPGAMELCNGRDDNCAGGVDEPPAGANSCSVVQACVAGACVSPRIQTVGDSTCIWRGDTESPFLCTGHAGGHLWGRVQGGLVVGGLRACVIHAGGYVMCWALSTGEPGFFDPVSLVMGVTDAVEVAASSYHACARRVDGTVLCWGEGDDGRLGTDTSDAAVARVVPGVANAVEVAVGQEFSCARLMNRTVLCWGDNTYGQLGNGSSADSPTPVQVTGLTDAVELEADGRYACARRANNTVACWGSHENSVLGNGASTSARTPGPVSNLTDVAEVALGDAHACARRSDGTVACWGNSGAGATGSSGSTPLPTTVAGITDATQISAGSATTCARRADGSAVCWGYNGEGQLGNGSTSSTPTPTPVLGLTATSVIATGSSHTCALRPDGVWCWGRNHSGIGGSSAVPISLTGPSGVTEITVGRGHACGRRADGTVLCWGYFGGGTLGNGSTGGSGTPVMVSGLTDAVQLASGYAHTCARRATGAVVCWGSDTYGGLGNTAVMGTQSQPVAVDGLTDAVSIAAGETFVCAARMTGAVVCWGVSQWSGPADAPPTAVAGISDAVEIDVGADFGCVRRSSGGLKCWGAGNVGQLGSGSFSSNSAVDVAGITNAVEIDTGAQHACARLATGEVRCWGRGGNGQVGNSESLNSDSRYPVTVTGLAGALALDAGTVHSCARRLDGTVMCWGKATFGLAGAVGPFQSSASYGPTALPAVAFVPSP